MQTMEMVDIRDVHPYEVDGERMNPRDVGSPECREYISQLAGQFGRNRLNPGQPRMRPILYRDGGIYWIVDGECRVEAMRSIGTARFWADVYDDAGEAELARQEAAKAMVETDAKRALAPEELSRGVQTMLALDLPDEDVAAAARIDAPTVRRVRRASRAVRDAAYDMTLDRLAAIADLEGDPEAVAEVRDCPPSEWRRRYEAAVARRDARAAVGRMLRAARDAGVRVVDARPEGLVAERTFAAFDEGRLASYLASEGRCEVAMETGGGTTLTFLAPADEGADEERARAAEERSELEAALREDEARRLRWVGERIHDLGSMRRTAALLTRRAHEHYSVSAFEAEVGTTLVRQTTELSVALGMEHRSWPHPWTVSSLLAGFGGHLQPESCADALELLEAMEADGYEPSESERRAAEAFRAGAKGGDGE